MSKLEGRSLDIVKEGKNYAHVAIPAADGSVQTVIVWDHANADEDIDFLAQKYIDQASYPFRQPGEQRVTFTLRPERVNYVNQG